MFLKAYLTTFKNSVSDFILDFDTGHTVVSGNKFSELYESPVMSSVLLQDILYDEVIDKGRFIRNLYRYYDFFLRNSGYYFLKNNYNVIYSDFNVGFFERYLRFTMLSSMFSYDMLVNSPFYKRLSEVLGSEFDKQVRSVYNVLGDAAYLVLSNLDLYLNYDRLTDSSKDLVIELVRLLPGIDSNRYDRDVLDICFTLYGQDCISPILYTYLTYLKKDLFFRKRSLVLYFKMRSWRDFIGYYSSFISTNFTKVDGGYGIKNPLNFRLILKNVPTDLKFFKEFRSLRDYIVYRDNSFRENMVQLEKRLIICFLRLDPKYVIETELNDIENPNERIRVVEKAFS